MAQFQVVAVYPSGRRFEVREPHETFLKAEWHKRLCEKSAAARDTWTYEVDVYYIGSDGQRHWRGNVNGEELGYSAEELELACG